MHPHSSSPGNVHLSATQSLKQTLNLSQNSQGQNYPNEYASENQLDPNSLEEDRDDLNDETFGVCEAVGTDFDFAGQTEKLRISEGLENNDTMNNETFGDSQVGNDFDFSGQTQRMLAQGSHPPHLTARPILEGQPPQQRMHLLEHGQQMPYYHPGGNVLHHQKDFNPPQFMEQRAPMPNMVAVDPRQLFEFQNQQLAQGNYQNLNYSQPIPAPLQERPLDYHGSSSPFSHQDQQLAMDPRNPVQNLFVSHGHASGIVATPPLNIMTLDMVEANLRPISVPQQHVQPNSNQPFSTTPPVVEGMQPGQTKKQYRKTQRLLKEQEMRRYNNMMTSQEKQWVIKVQVSQLVSDLPNEDDFYYTVYTTLHNKSNPSLENKGQEATPNHPHSSESSGYLHMQAHIKRIAEEAKKRPKFERAVLEGTLGKVVTNSVRNPKQLIEVDAGSCAEDSSTKPVENKVERTMKTSGTATRRALMTVERVYGCFIILEEIKRTLLMEIPKLEREVIESEKERLISKQTALKDKLWGFLPVMVDEVGFGEVNPLAQYLSYSKGKRSIPRLIPYLEGEQVYQFLNALLSSLDSLDVTRLTSHTIVTDFDNQHPILSEVEVFVNSVISPLVSYVLDISMMKLCNSFKILMARNNVKHLIKTKVGAIVMTLFLEKAAISQSDPEIVLWKDHYNEFFNLIKGSLSVILPPRLTRRVELEFDDAYVWQFFAALGANATVDQQHILVTEIRQKILENVTLAKQYQSTRPDYASQKINNLNLLLHTLGLDASQVMAQVP